MRTLVYVWMWPHSWSHKYILVLILSPQNRFTTPFWSGSVRPQRVTYDPTAWPSTVSLSSILYSSPCLINVIPASLSINLYETGAQWLSKTNQSCCTAPLMNSRSLAQLEEIEKYRLEGGRHLCPFFLLFGCRGVQQQQQQWGLQWENISSIIEWGWACHHYEWEEEACQST